MKSTVVSALVVAMLSVPVLGFAQQTETPLSRAQVRAELAQLERAGYRPSGEDQNYPADIQAAEARIDTASTGVGGTTPATQMGRSGTRSHTPSACVGPQSFCNIYSGS